jgi:hypothetical protein
MASWQEVIPSGLPVGPTRRVRKGQREGTVVGLHEDGSQFTLWVVMTPRRSKDGMPIGFLALWSDNARAKTRTATQTATCTSRSSFGGAATCLRNADALLRTESTSAVACRSENARSHV